jgi:hypothetical protein
MRKKIPLHKNNYRSITAFLHEDGVDLANILALP